MKLKHLRHKLRSGEPEQIGEPQEPPRAIEPAKDQTERPEPEQAGAVKVYISLHTSAPDGATKEASYIGYRRVSATLAPAKDGVMANEEAIEFPACVGGSETITHTGIELAGSMAVGPITRSLHISAGLTPRFGPGELSLTLR